MTKGNDPTNSYETVSVSALAEALRSENVRKYVMEAWVDGGVSEPGYATPDEMADAILAALDAAGYALTTLEREAQLLEALKGIINANHPGESSRGPCVCVEHENARKVLDE